MTFSNNIRKPNTRARRRRGSSTYHLRIGRVTVSADELVSWQLGPVISPRDRRGALRAERG